MAGSSSSPTPAPTREYIVRIEVSGHGKSAHGDTMVDLTITQFQGIAIALNSMGTPNSRLDTRLRALLGKLAIAGGKGKTAIDNDIRT